MVNNERCVTLTLMLYIVVIIIMSLKINPHIPVLIFVPSLSFQEYDVNAVYTLDLNLEQSLVQHTSSAKAVRKG